MAELRYINERGIVVADTANTRADVEREWRAVFGQDLVVDPETPQGVIITALVQERDNTARAMAEVANQFNPNMSTGVFLDGLMTLMGGQRFSATHSTIPGVILGGVPGTIIQTGSRVMSINNDIFLTASTAILAANGQAMVDVRAMLPGRIEVQPGDLNRVAESVLGWETVTNDSAAVVGREEESNVRARNRRRNILGANTISVNEAIISRLYMIPEVQSLSFRENYEDVPLVIDGITLKPKSIYVVVNGGTGEEIAKALKDTKTIGGGYNGSIEVVITDEITGQPYPILFDRPEVIDLFCRVTVKPSAVDAQTVVRQAIAEMVDGNIDGDPGLTVGRSVSPFEISAAINYLEPILFVRRVELSTDGTVWTTDEREIRIDQIASLAQSSIQVIVQ